MSAEHFRRDARLSYRARGIHEYLLTLPPGASMRVREIAAHGQEGETAVRKAMYELQEYGYLLLDRQRQDDGTLRTSWHVSPTAMSAWALGPA